MKTTRNRWRELCQRIGARFDPPAVIIMDLIYQRMVSAYNGPNRHYHDLGHINDCLTRFDEVKNFFQSPNEAEVALWLHDVVYNTGVSTNEEESCVFTNGILAQMDIPTAFRVRVMNLIMATTHDHVPGKPDNQLIADIDLAGLGNPWEKFCEDAEKIRQEYKATPEEFRIGRINFFKKFLEGRPSIYSSATFRDKCEEQAEKNIKRYLTENGSPNG